MRVQLWRIPQGISNILNLKGLKKDIESDEIEQILFPDNVATIASFKNNHLGCPLTQVIWKKFLNFGYLIYSI